MSFLTYKCYSCGHVWNSSESIIFWIKKGCVKCSRKDFISLYVPRCPDCKEKLKPIIDERIRHRASTVRRYVRRWECTNPNCTVISLKHGRHGVKVKRAAAL